MGVSPNREEFCLRTVLNHEANRLCCRRGHSERIRLAGPVPGVAASGEDHGVLRGFNLQPSRRRRSSARALSAEFGSIAVGTASTPSTRRVAARTEGVARPPTPVEFGRRDAIDTSRNTGQDLRRLQRGQGLGQEEGPRAAVGARAAEPLRGARARARAGAGARRSSSARARPGAGAGAPINPRGGACCY